LSFRTGPLALALTLLASTAHAQDALGAAGERDESEARVAHLAREPRVDAEARATRPAREQRKHKHVDRARRAARTPAVSPQYEELKRSWHSPWAEAEPATAAADAPPALVLHPVGKTPKPYVLMPNSDQGGFEAEQLAVAAQAFESWEGGPAVSQRLLDLVYHAAQHFQVWHVHLVSGVRHDRGGSRHSHGLAADIVLPGVEDEELAHYFRAQGFVGVGVYTRSGFVHLDVRDKSFFWIDPSPPDRHLKIRPVRADEARLADEAALARGSDTFVNPPKLQKALHVRAKRKREQRARQQLAGERSARPATRASKDLTPANPAAL
jgi:Peptidase M15